ncbi:MAG: LysE family transporter [bacterium]
MDAANALGHLAVGFGLGASLAIPPGPVNALIAREAGRHGTMAGIRAGIPAPIVDTTYMLLVLFGVAHLVDLQAIAPWLAGVGAFLMAYLAWDTVRVRHGVRELPGPWAVWAVTLSNPFQYAWWISAGVTFLAATGAWGIAGFLCAIFGWVVTFSFLVSRGAQKWGWFTPLLEIVSADLLFAFALQLGAAAAGL